MWRGHQRLPVFHLARSQNAEAFSLAREFQPLQEGVKARIRSQLVEQGIDLQQRDQPAAVVIGALQVHEGLIALAETDVVKRANVS